MRLYGVRPPAAALHRITLRNLCVLCASAVNLSAKTIKPQSTVLVQFENTPKAFANFSPGFEEREPWGPHIRGVLNPDRV